MCGIVGKIVSLGCELGLTKEKKNKVQDSIHHRGPDMQGQYEDDCVWFGHVRLSIIDLSDAASQPMATSDGRFVICYNGEVYNFTELAQSLNLQDMRSHSDTEVVLRAFAKLGVEAIKQLNGMFAFALYDKYAQKLWLVRDRLGIKPLYYRIESQELSFSSEIKGIFALSEDTPVCDVSFLHEWLYYGNTLGGRTLYKGIKQLLPGHYLEIDLKSFQYVIHDYWSLQHQASPTIPVLHCKKDMIVETRRLLEQAVRRQLVSDVPVGVFLSGGIDSSAIVAFATRYYGGRLATYSAGFDFAQDVGELPKAKRVANLFGTEHHEIYIAGGHVGDLVEKMIKHHDMPFSDAANIPLYLMASQISGSTKVVLQGDGGDEVFGGYRRYVTLKYRPWFRPIARLVQNVHSVLPPTTLHHRVQRYLNAFAAKETSLTMALLLTPKSPHTFPTTVFTPRVQAILEMTDPFTRYRECQQYFAGHDIGNQMSLVDLMIVLPDIYLEKVDRATMAASLEVRVPFLDHNLVDYVVRIPGNKKMPLGKKKWLLKKALEGIVPHDILYGPKTGFNVPFGYWLRTSLKQLFFDHLTKFNREWPDIVKMKNIQEIYNMTDREEQGYSDMLWNLLNLFIWVNNSKVDIRI